MDAFMSMVSPITTSAQTRNDLQKRDLDIRKITEKPAVSFRDQFQTIYAAPDTGNVTARPTPATRIRPAAMFLT